IHPSRGSFRQSRRSCLTTARKVSSVPPLRAERALLAVERVPGVALLNGDERADPEDGDRPHPPPPARRPRGACRRLFWLSVLLHRLVLPLRHLGHISTKTTLIASINVLKVGIHRLPVGRNRGVPRACCAGAEAERGREDRRLARRRGDPQPQGPG